ncbi:MAG TPA: putative manganese transporter [Candidatus Omnitrophota bacterium]|nr:putative manganese transporter [Candidatus Omnitrophota bacterium]HPS36263.1 putative manganese transporter [Candidatus Omnitrophota bacterium]
MMEAFWEAWNETLAMIPWLVGIYVLLEIVERKYEHLITGRLSKASRGGPLLGALFGCIPQCGFSVIAAALYGQRTISLGTLLAVFLSTSDEAVPILMTQSAQWGIVVRLLLTKVLIATIAGYAIDFFLRSSSREKKAALHDPVVCESSHSHCCGRDHSCKETWWKSFILFPLKHAFQVFLFILVASWILNGIVLVAGQERLTNILLAHNPFQPIISVLVGLIPTCAASVTITELFLKGGISFGSAVAGLCAGAGLGTLVLIRENKDHRETLKIIGLLAGISLLAGFILNLF